MKRILSRLRRAVAVLLMLTLLCGTLAQAASAEYGRVFVSEVHDLRIEDRAFYGCTKIPELTLTENVRYLGESAFGDTRNITEVTVNSSGNVTFKDGAFVSAYGGSSVKTLHIGKGLANVDISAVFGGTNAVLATVTVDKENNYYYEGSDGVIYDKHLNEEQVNVPTKILYYPMLKEGEYELPGSITTIGANVFVGRKKLTKVTIGANVTEIGNAAFKDCNQNLFFAVVEYA